MHKAMDVGVPVSPGGEEMLAASAAMDERDDDLLDDDDTLDDDDDDDALNLSDDDDDDDADDAITSTDMDEDEDAELTRDDDSEDDDYTDGDDSAWPRQDSTAAPSTTTTSTTTTTTTTTTQSSTATSDPYFSHFDPRTEHQSYKDAQQRLEETHREKITKVMKDWSELEDRYQEMMSTDPAAAQTFRQRMTAKFQANVQALEEEGVSERRRLAALHQQRVLAHLAQRRRTALACYSRSLRDTPANGRRVQKCLQRLVRALAAQRAGALAAWRRAAAAGPEAAAAERSRASDRLQDADRAMQRALNSLRRRPYLYANIGTAIEDYIQSMQSKDDIAVSLMSMTPEAEELLLDRIGAEVQREQSARDQLQTKRDQRVKQREDIQNERAKTSNGVKESDETDDEASENVDILDMSMTSSSSAAPHTSTEADTTTSRPTTRYTQETSTTEMATSTMTEIVASASEPDVSVGSEGTDMDLDENEASSAASVDSGALQEALEQAEERAPPPPAHSLKHELQHSQPGYTIRGAEGVGSGAGALYPALCVGGAALAAAAAVALAVARRRTRAPPAQGFVQVEQTGVVAPTPEERHVANMQINGYENPTYKYFEVKE